jgi:AraC family transcriptional regulator of arabinose operon
MFHAIKGGCGTKHPSSYKMSRPEGLPNYVILIIKTQGEFLIEDQSFSVTPGHAIILAPNTPYFYGNPEGDYIDDWVHFNVENPSYFQEKQLITNTPFPIRNTDLFSSLIKQILWENSYSPSPFCEQNIDALFTLLNNHLATALSNLDDSKHLSYYHDQLQLLRLDLQNSPSDNHSIEECAGKLGISPSYFQHLYTSFFGISYRKDLIRIRIDQAKFLMGTTDLTMDQIAEICGYHNEVHFYRQFKKIVGITPAKYRKEGHQSF